MPAAHARAPAPRRMARNVRSSSGREAVRLAGSVTAWGRPHTPEAPMTTTEDVPLAQSALLVIDAQDSFKATPRWDRRSNLAFEANVAALVDAYRAAGLPVIYFLHTDGDD